MTPKRKPTKPKPRNRKYTDKQRMEAVAAYATSGLAQAAAVTRIPKSTILLWAKKAGIDSAEVAARSADQMRAQTEASMKRRALYIATAREELAEQQAQTAYLATEYEQRILRSGLALLDAVKDAPVDAQVLAEVEEVMDGTLGSGKTAPVLPDTPEVRAALRMLSAAQAGPHLGRIVGSKTRAVHDLLRLLGETSEQAVDRGLTIVFAAPTPNAAVEGRIVDIKEIEGDDIEDAEIVE